jgi:hypothetical protein
LTIKKTSCRVLNLLVVRKKPIMIAQAVIAAALFLR